MACGSFTQGQVPVKNGEKHLILIPNCGKRDTAVYFKMPLAVLQEKVDEEEAEKLQVYVIIFPES